MVALPEGLLVSFDAPPTLVNTSLKGGFAPADPHASLEGWRIEALAANKRFLGARCSLEAIAPLGDQQVTLPPSVIHRTRH